MVTFAERAWHCLFPARMSTVAGGIPLAMGGSGRVLLLFLSIHVRMEKHPGIDSGSISGGTAG